MIGVTPFCDFAPTVPGPTQKRVLDFIKSRPDGATLRAICAASGCTRKGAADVLRRLADKALVARTGKRGQYVYRLGGESGLRRGFGS